MLPFIADLPPQQQERVVCSITAAMKYDVPANILLAVAEKEAGKPGQRVRNTNGTYDVGPMQFNTTYLSDLKQYGISAEDVAASGCYSYELAAWRIAKHIRDDKGDIWTKAANYHSRTYEFNQRYRADLIVKAVKWADWLETHFKPDPYGKTPTIPAPVQTGKARSEAKPTGYVSRAITFSGNQ